MTREILKALLFMAIGATVIAVSTDVTDLVDPTVSLGEANAMILEFNDNPNIDDPPSFCVISRAHLEVIASIFGRDDDIDGVRIYTGEAHDRNIGLAVGAKLNETGQLVDISVASGPLFYGVDPIVGCPTICDNPSAVMRDVVVDRDRCPESAGTGTSSGSDSDR